MTHSLIKDVKGDQANSAERGGETARERIVTEDEVAHEEACHSENENKSGAVGVMLSDAVH